MTYDPNSDQEYFPEEQNQDPQGIPQQEEPAAFEEQPTADPHPEEEFTVKEVASKCSWSPYEGQTLKGAVKMVWVNGVLTAKDGAIVSDRSAKALYFK